MQKRPVMTACTYRTASCQYYLSMLARGGLISALGLLSFPAVGLELKSNIDNVIAGLPGVLIASLAIVFAIRERGRYKRLLLKQQSNDVAPATPIPHQQLAAEYSNVGLWQTDANGHTLYANPVMCQLLGVSSSEPLKSVTDQRLLKPLHPHSVQANTPYSAALHTFTDDKEIAVLVFEQPVKQADCTYTLRTVIDPATLPQRLLQQCRQHLIAAV